MYDPTELLAIAEIICRLVELTKALWKLLTIVLAAVSKIRAQHKDVRKS